ARKVTIRTTLPARRARRRTASSAPPAGASSSAPPAGEASLHARLARRGVAGSPETRALGRCSGMACCSCRPLGAQLAALLRREQVAVHSLFDLWRFLVQVGGALVDRAAGDDRRLQVIALNRISQLTHGEHAVTNDLH